VTERSAPLLVLERVTKRYWRGDTRLRVLNEVSLEVEPGDFVVIRGRRASGKTTLLRVAAGVEEPDEGRVHFEGQDINRLSGGRRAALLGKDIAIIQRRGPATPLEVLDYVALPLLGRMSRSDCHHRAEVALRKVGVEDCANQTWDRISNGCRAFVSIAHALVRGPKLILADDPAAEVGTVERMEILALLTEVARDAGVGVVMTSPELTGPMGKLRLLNLSDGELVGPARSPGAVIPLRLRRPIVSGQ
jgi:ABC-type lipoprotein export system ATPase subunit